MKKIVVIFIVALMLAASMPIQAVAVSSFSAYLSSYIPVVETAIAETNAADWLSGYGFLYDIDADGVEELVIESYFFDGIGIETYSVYDIMNGKVIAKRDHEILRDDVTMLDFKVGVANYSGQTVLYIHTSHILLEDESYLFFNPYDFREIASASCKDSYDNTDGYYETWSVNGKICSVNGQTCSYDDYLNFMNTVELIVSTKSNSCMTLEELLRYLKGSALDTFFQFRGGTDKIVTTVTAEYYYDDSFFQESSWIYNHELARMSLAVATAAFNSEDDQNLFQNPNTVPDYNYELEDLKNSPAKNVVTLLDNCGFDSIMANYDYLVDTGYNQEYNDGENIGVVIGNKKINDTTLIAVAVRGGGYGCEWIGNFHFYNPNNYPYHIGFWIARNHVLAALRDYVNDNNISGNVKIWISGYSRGAATSNLVSAELCKNGLTGCKLSPESVYAYTFETPMGTKDRHARDAVYNGIWNIINPIDLVPCVAMAKWGYTRYGNTVYLPSPFTDSISYNRYKNSALDYLNRYTRDAGLRFDKIPYVVFQNKIVNGIADGLADALDSDSTYISSRMESAMQKYFMTNSIKASIDTILASIVTNPGQYMNFLSESDYQLVSSTVQAGVVYIIDQNVISKIVYAHYPELCLAWLNAIPPEAMKENGTIRYFYANCPVNIDVYVDDALQLQIMNDEVFSINDAYVEAIVDNDGQKIICIPEDVEARVEVLSTNNGEFNVSLQEYDLAENDVTKVVNYYDIPIAEGSSFTATVSAVTASGTEYHLFDKEHTEIEPSETLAGTAVEVYTVTVEAEGPGSVSGVSRKTRGEFAQVTATPDANASFIGWYEGETFVSKDAKYRFCVSRNVELKAVFAAAELPSFIPTPTPTLTPTPEPTPVPTPESSEWTVVEEPGCETTGIKERTNPDAPGNPEREAIPALGHDWQPATYSQPETCSRCGKQQGSTLQPPPGPSDMAGYSGIQAPQSTSWLAARETRYVYAPHGAAVYIYKGPSFGYEKVNGNIGVADGTELTLLALENGMYLVKTGNGLLGWINSSNTSETRLIDTMPQLTGSYWIFSKGAGDSYTFACKFDSSTKLVGFRLSDGKKMAWTCRLAGRVLVIDKTKFIWDGEQFAYETQAFLWVDPDQTFDKYS